MKRSGIARGQKPMQRGKRIKQRRRRVRDVRELSALRAPDKWRDASYRTWLGSRPCLVCLHLSPLLGRKSSSYACHTVNGGTGFKGPDRLAVPLCLQHHDEYDGRQKLPGGAVGKRAFEVHYSISMAAEAVKLNEAYEQETMKPQ